MEDLLLVTGHYHPHSMLRLLLSNTSPVLIRQFREALLNMEASHPLDMRPKIRSSLGLQVQLRHIKRRSTPLSLIILVGEPYVGVSFA